MAVADWYIEGRAFGNCNCDYGCPCQFEARPTAGHCRGFEALQIERGHFGDVDLSGLRCAMLYAWPGPIHEGKGALQAIIDRSASPEQARALETVLHGGETDEGRTHWWVYRAMSDTVHPTLHNPIEIEIDIEARTARVSIPGILTASGRPIRPPHGDGEHRVQIALPDGIEFELAEIGSASTTADAAITLRLDDSYGQWNVVRHSGTGIVR